MTKTKVSKKEMEAAMLKLLSMPTPQFDMEKIGKLLQTHHRDCGLCRLLGRRFK